MNKKKIAEIFARFKAARPAPTTELEYRTPFELLVAVILSAQATDKSVNIATRVLFKEANTPQAILALGIPGISACARCTRNGREESASDARRAGIPRARP